MSTSLSDFSFFWHDYETFGINPRRDRPAQFAGLRTDADLNEIGEPVMLYCQPASDALPDPHSCLLTGIVPQLCSARGLVEALFAAKIESELAHPGTVGVGYNSIRFDDEVTRHLFWRNLIDPYAREWQNGCSRWDLLDVVRATYALRPDGITWPKADDGRVSFRLEHLTEANGVSHESAHDAMSDVMATLALARLVKGAQPRLWDFCLKLRKKDAVLAEISLAHPAPAIHVSGMYSVDRGCMTLVWPLAEHPVNRNELIVWDLMEDPTELQSMDVDTMRQRLFNKQEQLPEGVRRLPIKTIHINKSPIVISQLKVLDTGTASRWSISVDRCMRHAEMACKLRLPSTLWSEVFSNPSRGIHVDVDEDLYGGLIGSADRRSLEKLRSLEPSMLATKDVHFDDPRLKELLFRYRARNFPETLNDDEAARWLEHRIARLHRGFGGGQSLSQFLDRIDQLSESADERGQGVLSALYDYAEQIAPEF